MDSLYDAMEYTRSKLVLELRHLHEKYGVLAFGMPEYDELHRRITEIDAGLDQFEGV